MLIDPNISYYEESQKLLKSLKEKYDHKPSLVIHACCAPCACYPLEVLEPYFDITILYTNSNIYPKEEYDIRLNELIKYVDSFNKQYQSDVKLVIPEYENAHYMRKISTRAHDHEGGESCHKCYELRLRDCFEYAKENHLDFAGTVMSISRQKNSKVLNQIGLKLEEEYGIPFLIADFKKKGGQVRRDELSKDMYKQLYCGCVYSLMEAQERIERKQES